MIIPPSIAAFFSKWGMAMIGLAIALAATFYAGKLHERSGWESRRADQVEAARATEQAGVAIANTAGADHSADLKQQLEKANAELATLRAALPTVPDCRVPRRVVRMLDGQRMPKAAGSAGKPAPAAAPMATDPGAAAEEVAETVECRVVIDSCANNRVNVCEPNALQVEGLQRFYERLQRQYNKQP
jgi:hypothetical protein